MNTALEIIKAKVLSKTSAIWHPDSPNFWIRTQNSHTKGYIGEQIVLARFADHEIQDRTSSEHDRIVNGKKWEIKLSCLNENTELKWGHIKAVYDYDVLFLIGVYPDTIRMWNLPRALVTELREQKIIKYYKKATEDDQYPNCYLPLKGHDLPKWLLDVEVPFELKAVA